MQPQEVQLVVSHAGWVLDSDPEAGLEALLAVTPPLQPELVMPLLQVGRQGLCSWFISFLYAIVWW